MTAKFISADGEAFEKVSEKEEEEEDVVNQEENRGKIRILSKSRKLNTYRK